MKSLFFFMAAIALLAVFAGVNWQAFSQPTEINLLFATVTTPLGIVLLGIIGLLLMAMALVLAWAQAASLLQQRAHTRESERLRSLSEDAEASRLTQLRNWLESELRAHVEHADRIAEGMTARMNAMEAALLKRQEEGENSLSAQLGELEDRLDGGSGRIPTRHSP